ncbi:MAG: hypothetical protein ACKVPJ_01420 [Chitinophagales bacterium]
MKQTLLYLFFAATASNIFAQTLSGTTLEVTGTSGTTVNIESGKVTYNATNDELITTGVMVGINNTPDETFIIQQPDETGKENDPVVEFKNTQGELVFVFDLEEDDPTMGLINSTSGLTTSKFRSNGISFILERFAVGESLTDIMDQNPQFKVVGLQTAYNTTLSEASSDMTDYQTTIQNHDDTNGKSASLGFGVDVDGSSIGGSICFVRSDNNSFGSLRFGVKETTSATVLVDLIVLSGTNVNFPRQTASRIAVFDASKNLVSGTTGSGLSLATDVLSLDINGLTILSGTVDVTNDYLPIYDASASANRKVSAGDITGSYSLQGSTRNLTGIADLDDYYIGTIAENAGTISDINRVYIPQTGVIKAAYVYFHNGTVTTSTTAGAVSIRLSTGTNVAISNTITNDASSTVASNTSLNQSVMQGQYFEIKWDCPNWGMPAPPDDVQISFVVYIQ